MKHEPDNTRTTSRQFYTLVGDLIMQGLEEEDIVAGIAEFLVTIPTAQRIAIGMWESTFRYEDVSRLVREEKAVAALARAEEENRRLREALNEWEGLAATSPSVAGQMILRRSVAKGNGRE